jgi:membrane protease YdiL (CAAX protease family)
MLVEEIVPTSLFIALWLDGWVYPLLLAPFLYVFVIEKKHLSWLGFQKQGLQSSMNFGSTVSILLMALYYFIFLNYFPLILHNTPNLYDLFTDIIWYPLYEEVTYRAFFLSHFTVFNLSPTSKRNFGANLIQSLMFVSIHWHHITAGFTLILIPVFLLAITNGFIYQKTGNIYGCIFSHSALNVFALLLRFI